MCGENQFFNRVTLPDRFPLPHTEDIAAFFHGVLICPNEVRVKLGDRILAERREVHKIAITKPFGLFEYYQGRLTFTDDIRS